MKEEKTENGCCQLTVSSWNMAKLAAAFGVSNTVVGDSERRCHRHKDGPPPHTCRQLEFIQWNTEYTKWSLTGPVLARKTKKYPENW